VIASNPQTVFRYWEGAASERARPDVWVVPLPFLDYPGAAQAVTRHHPELAALVAAYRARAQVDVALRALHLRRPVLLELNAQVPTRSYRDLLPVGMLHAVLGRRPSAREIEAAAARQDAMHRALQRQLGASVHELETSRQLLWADFMDTLYYAQQGRPDLAAAPLSRGRALYPEDRLLAELARALQTAHRGQPLEIARFLEFR